MQHYDDVMILQGIAYIFNVVKLISRYIRFIFYEFFIIDIYISRVKYFAMRTSSS